MSIFNIVKRPLMKNIVLFALLALAISSCVPNRKYVLLQKNDVNRKDLVKDSLLRTYSFTQFEYKIQPEDILSIRFESLTPKEYDFFGDNTPMAAQGMGQQANPLLIGELVDDNGMVPFPIIGKVKVSGLTVYEAQDTLQKLANQYLENPLVKVRLINFRITVYGEVNREGTVTLNNNRVNMLEALALAGGLTDLADRSQIKLVRQKDGIAEIQYIDLLDEDFLASPYYYVNQNDILIVPALRQRPYRKYFGQNLGVILSSLTLVVLTINLATQ
jgi:polysaccharide export outer membrane protein